MMCYGGKEGTFPLLIEECKCIECLCNERIAEMNSDLKNKDSHMYVMIKSLAGKISGFIELMDSRQKEEIKRNEEEYKTIMHLDIYRLDMNKEGQIKYDSMD